MSYGTYKWGDITSGPFEPRREVCGGDCLLKSTNGRTYSGTWSSSGDRFKDTLTVDFEVGKSLSGKETFAETFAASPRYPSGQWTRTTTIYSNGTRDEMITKL